MVARQLKLLFRNALTESQIGGINGSLPIRVYSDDGCSVRPAGLVPRIAGRAATQARPISIATRQLWVLRLHIAGTVVALPNLQQAEAPCCLTKLTIHPMGVAACDEQRNGARKQRRCAAA